MVGRGSNWSWCELMATGPSRPAATPSGRPAPPGSSAPLIIPLRPRQTCAALGKSDIESGDPIWKGKLKSCCCCGDMKASSSPRTIMNPGGRKARRGGIVRRADEVVATQRSPLEAPLPCDHRSRHHHPSQPLAPESPRLAACSSLPSMTRMQAVQDPRAAVAACARVKISAGALGPVRGGC